MFLECHLPPAFIELLNNGMENYGNDMRHDDGPDEDYRLIPFKKLFKMYIDDIEIEPDLFCICKIPKEWIKKLKILLYQDGSPFFIVNTIALPVTVNYHINLLWMKNIILEFY